MIKTLGSCQKPSLLFGPGFPRPEGFKECLERKDGDAFHGRMIPPNEIHLETGFRTPVTERFPRYIIHMTRKLMDEIGFECGVRIPQEHLMRGRNERALDAGAQDHGPVGDRVNAGPAIDSSREGHYTNKTVRL